MVYDDAMFSADGVIESPSRETRLYFRSTCEVYSDYRCCGC